jgi:hypothetical protein
VKNYEIKLKENESEKIDEFLGVKQNFYILLKLSVMKKILMCIIFQRFLTFSLKVLSSNFSFMALNFSALQH